LSSDAAPSCTKIRVHTAGSYSPVVRLSMPPELVL
jgi:hypothetical protein